MIAVVDYGVGNVGSIVNMLKRVGCRAEVISDAGSIAQADKLILPGVGAFDSGMARLRELDLIDVLESKAVKEKVPILGLCLGVQLFTRGSEEGELPGLGWLDAHTIRFRTDGRQATTKVPHMGWNYLQVQRMHPVFTAMPQEARFYFVHSYHLVCNQAEDVLATTLYGYEFVSMVHKDNLIGAQFHPEKSHKFGMQLLKNFVELF